MNESIENNVTSTRRDFIKKFGTYAATAPVGMYMLMTPSASAHATSSVEGDGWCRTRVTKSNWKSAKSWYSKNRSSMKVGQSYRSNSKHAATHSWDDSSFKSGRDYWVAKRDNSKWSW